MPGESTLHTPPNREAISTKFAKRPPPSREATSTKARRALHHTLIRSFIAARLAFVAGSGYISGAFFLRETIALELVFVGSSWI